MRPKKSGACLQNHCEMQVAFHRHPRPTSVLQTVAVGPTHTSASSRHRRLRRLNSRASRRASSDYDFHPLEHCPPWLPKQPEGTGHGVRGFSPAEPATASVLSSSLTGLPARFAANGSRLPCRARSFIFAGSALTACLAAGLRPVHHPRGNHVRSFPRNTARLPARFSPAPAPTSTDSPRCRRPSDHAPGHQLASRRRSDPAGRHPRSRLKPSPISDKHVVELVVTSPGTLCPLGLEAHSSCTARVELRLSALLRLTQHDL